MRKLSLVFLFVSLFSVASFAKTTKAKTTVRHLTAAKVQPVKHDKMFFPVTFVTSCGTWTGDATCGGSLSDCIDGLNAIGDFLESLCS